MGRQMDEYVGVGGAALLPPPRRLRRAAGAGRMEGARAAPPRRVPGRRHGPRRARHAARGETYARSASRCWGWSASAKIARGRARRSPARGELEAFLARTRALVCMLPLTPATAGLLNRDTLGKLPQGAYVVNVARGGLVVDDDLIALLDSGHLAGATLDVFHEEPLPASHRFWSHPKVFLTPHYLGGDAGRGFGRAGRREDPRARAGRGGHRRGRSRRAGY